MLHTEMQLSRKLIKRKDMVIMKHVLVDLGGEGALNHRWPIQKNPTSKAFLVTTLSIFPQPLYFLICCRNMYATNVAC